MAKETEEKLNSKTSKSNPFIGIGIIVVAVAVIITGYYKLSSEPFTVTFTVCGLLIVCAAFYVLHHRIPPTKGKTTTWFKEEDKWSNDNEQDTTARA